MTRYIKFNEDGAEAYEAPFSVSRDGETVIGYNRPTNEKMLLADGWLKYTGNCPLDKLKLWQGVIIEEEWEPEDVLPTKFTKLQIRRCLRKHGHEDALDRVLSSDFSFRKDWDDCLNIDLEDEMMREAVKGGLISEDLISLIQHECEGIG